jgi:peptide/nickel transport system permease protein
LTSFLVRRIIQTLVVIIIVSFISFLMLQITPGDPATTMLGTDAPKEQIKELQKELWLDRPFLVQYGHWLFNAIQGDLGRSLYYRDTVTAVFSNRVFVTGYLAFFALILSIIFGIAAGTICAIRRGGFLDQREASIIFF